MIKYVNVLLANTAVSFCHYENSHNDKTEWIPVELLSNIMNYCQKNKVSINYIYPQDTVPEELADLIGKNQDIKIAPYKATVDATAIVIDPSDIDAPDCIDKISDKILILRIKKVEINKIHSFFERIINKFVKISILLLEIESYTEHDISNYKMELEKTEMFLFRQYKDVKEKLPEINFVSDLWFLKKMNNCNAGVDHCTFAPNGKFYICPAFYHNAQESVGDLESIQIKNDYLLALEYSPLCNQCDAYHCKRCVYLNHLLTEEYNIPSYQQCQITHIERECSRKLLERLKISNKLFFQIPSIKQIDYDDPIEKINNIDRYNIRRIL